MSAWKGGRSTERGRKGLLTAPTTDATRLCWSVLGRKSDTVVDWAALSPARVSVRNSCDFIFIILWLADYDDLDSGGRFGDLNICLGIKS
jgi:hypothetical protein